MFNVPQTGPYRLRRAPLAQALGQVRFPLQALLGTFEGIAKMQGALSETYPYLEQENRQGIEVQFTPEGAQASETPPVVNWSFSGDEGHQIVVSPTTATLSAGQEYESIDDFSERFLQVLNALEDIVHVPRCDRLGVRYLSIAEVPPTNEAAWREWFRPELLSWVGTGILDDSVALTASIHQVQYTADPVEKLGGLPTGVQAIVRHGFVPAGTDVPGIPPVTVTSSAYLLDLDLFVVAPQRFDPESLQGQLRSLHSQIDRFFRWTLTPAGEEYFGLEEG
jgi:uncharacterized protein (TIGR04255 family)